MTLSNTTAPASLSSRGYLQDVFLLTLGILMASVGLKGFLLPNRFLDGGAMGIALLTRIMTGVNLSLLIVLINLPFILIGVRQVSVEFAIKSALAILGLAVLVHFIELPVVTDDKLLIAVFGGFFLGSGIGLAIRGGAVIDGTEVMAIAISRRSSLSVGDCIALFNIILFSLAALLIDIETSMYSMLTYIAASKTIDFILNGIEEYIGVMIISDEAHDIRSKLVYELGRGVTVFKADAGYNDPPGMEKKVLFCAITRLEVSRMLKAIESVDRRAFIVQYPIKDTKGGMIKRRPLH